VKPPKPTEYKHGDVHKPTGRIFLAYAWHSNKWYEKMYQSTNIFGAQIENMWKGAKQRAIQEQLPFDIDMEYLKSIVTQTCPVFGIQLAWGTLGEGVSNNSPSLDKIKPEWGYVRGNVCIISYLANKIKQDVGWEEITQLGIWLKEKTKEVEQNVRPEQFASIPTRTYKPRQNNSEYGALLTARIGQDNNNANDHSGAVQGQNADHSTQASSGNSLEPRNQEVVAPVQLTLFQGNGQPEPEIIRLDFGGRYLLD